MRQFSRQTERLVDALPGLVWKALQCQDIG